MDVEYRYDTTGHNNGQIGSMKDWVSGTTNRITSSGFSYNANGTMAAMPNWQGTYDKESRLVDVTQSRNGTESYEYDGAGRRIWTSNGMTETIQFYGVDGKRLAKCQIQEVSYPAYGYTFACTGITYFLGQVVTGEGESGGWGPWGAARDRLGSVRAAPYGYYYYGQGVNASSYFPFGQARTGGSVWATYQPSSVSGTMYAMNREYSAAYGRFLTPDPSAGVSLADPGSWNKYGYVLNDPVNRLDPSGLDGCTAEPGTAVCFSVTGTGGSVADNPGFAMARAWYGLDSKGDTPLLLARQVGGRGRRGSGRPIDSKTNASARGLLDQRLEGFADSNCFKVLSHEGVRVQNILDSYSNESFYDVRSGSAYANLTLSQIDIAGSETATLSEILRRADAVTVGALGSPTTTAVLVGAQYFFSGSTDAIRMNSLLHEMLHALGGFNDTQILHNKYFLQNGLVNNSVGNILDTSGITDWLGRDCNK